MFCGTCDRCGTRQLFGYQRLARLDNEAHGVMALTWSCASCESLSVLRIGSAVTGGVEAGL